MLGVTSLAMMMATAAFARVEPSARTFTAGQEVHVKGVILSREGDTMKLRADDDSVGTIDITNETKVQMKHGMFGMSKTSMEATSLLPGLHVEVQGKGSDKGDLVASKVIFDPNSMRASKQIDARVSPLESRTGTLEGRAGKIEGRTDNLETQTGQLQTKTGQLETKAGELANQEQQTQQHVGQVQQEATKGIGDVNTRVTNLDDYTSKFSATVYFKVNSTALSPEAKQELDGLAQKALNEKGYMIEVAGFADKTGSVAHNQELSDARAQSVVQYLEEQGNVPLRRIMTPAGLGISHEAADNKTREGRKMNRRVEVNVLVNSGITAMSNPPTSPQSGTTAHQ
jgi:outer membrane protein OmpA-like peptidoglycan-associated protein